MSSSQSKKKSLAQKLAEGRAKLSADKLQDMQSEIEQRDRELAASALECPPNSTQQYKQEAHRIWDANVKLKLSENEEILKIKKEEAESQAAADALAFKQQTLKKMFHKR